MEMGDRGGGGGGLRSSESWFRLQLRVHQFPRSIFERQNLNFRKRECVCVWGGGGGGVYKYVTWCFTPSQPLRLYQGGRGVCVWGGGGGRGTS